MSPESLAAPARGDRTWTHTPAGEPRGYIQAARLTELWFHTGTICNLSCPFCLEGSKPGDKRIQQLGLADVQPFIREALTLGVEQFSFTGGEPFVIRDFPAILDHALQFRPCLVLTNGTKPLHVRLGELKSLPNRPHPVRFRISLDFPDEQRHDAGRGEGNFRSALSGLKLLHEAGFAVSVARHRPAGEDAAAVEACFRSLFARNGLPEDLSIVSFPEFLRPFSVGGTPHITESCMTTYHTEAGRASFMCAYTRMVLKKHGRMRVYACTLVDDDEDYDLGDTLTASLPVRVMLKHHRCYSCFAHGACCSELARKGASR
jgi:hypothetical protein